MRRIWRWKVASSGLVATIQRPMIRGYLFPQCRRERPARAGSGNALMILMRTDEPAARDARAKTLAPTSLRGRCQHLADSPDLVPLWRRQGKKLKPMAQAVPISHQGPKLHGIPRHRQHQFHGNNFPGFQHAGQSGPDTVLPQLVRPPPEGNTLPRAKNVDRELDVERITGKAARRPGIRLLFAVGHERLSPMRERCSTPTGAGLPAEALRGWVSYHLLHGCPA